MVRQLLHRSILWVGVLGAALPAKAVMEWPYDSTAEGRNYDLSPGGPSHRVGPS